MAEGILRHLRSDAFEVFSAGTNPSVINSKAIHVMSEIGIDISGHKSKSVQEFLDWDFDYIITVCDSAKESCPVFTKGAQFIHWSFIDPAGVKGTEEKILPVFRKVRDEIKTKTNELFGK